LPESTLDPENKTFDRNSKEDSHDRRRPDGER